MNNNKILSITTFATKSYIYALTAQIRRLQSAVNHAGIENGHFILVGDNSEEITRAEILFRKLLPKWQIHVSQNNFEGEFENYQESAQLIISQGRTEAFSIARSLNSDYCLSLDSDVLPSSHSIECMLHMLNFDKGYYSIATCPYVSQGGGGFLFGRGTMQRQILPDYYEDEREVPEDIIKKMKDLRESVNKYHDFKSMKEEERESIMKDFESKIKELQGLEKDLEKYPPKGNVWELNAKGWKKRGWGDNAYPAIGLGSVVPTDWCGFGCTMMNKEALDCANFDGYDGKGTEDLYIVWNRWYPRGLKICSIPHCLCDHIIRDKSQPGKYIHCQAYHETEGECVGHLRVRFRPFYTQDVGEKVKPNN